MKSHPLTRNFYYFGIFFLSLGILTTSFQSLNYLQHGAQIYAVPTLPSWLILTTIMDIVSSSILMKYYYHKKYRLTFFAGIFILSASVIFNVIIYIMTVFRALYSLYTPACIILLLISISFSIILIFSNSGNRPLLKLAGIFELTFGLILLTSVIGNHFFVTLQLKPVFEKINFYTSWLSCIVSALLLSNFVSELRQIKDQTGNLFNFKIIIPALIAIVPLLILGQKMYSKSQFVGFPHPISEKARGIASLFEARNYVNADGDTLRYRFMKPLDYNPENKYPLAVLLHHGGAHGTDNIIQVEGSNAPFFSNYVSKRKYPAFLFIPQCPQNLSWADPAFSKLIFEAIDDLEKQFSVDTKRRYVMGISGGGLGSWYFIGTHPEMFAAAIPMCGGTDPGLSENMTHVAIWAFHGDKDPLAPVSSTRSIIAGIRKAGGHPKYTEFANADHNIGGQVQRIPHLLDWLFAQKKD
ncbi:prolyl oligopeptidase family serine peptidase [Dyadobacter sp. 3J3]|uniref:carboxylesterase family protein n=1 Tax=Dyadobacter sp. 3J3 TaxID=2606600 RepID=UPI0013576EDE|nr:prolyl oligopeptidase family serine peptidase [Dyadobacter sp. 3J3]